MGQRRNWGVLGGSEITSAILRGLEACDAGQVVAVGSRSAARGAAFAARHHIPQVLSYEALITSPEIDFVYLPLPNALHVEWALRALAAGKPVLCEKPIALDAAGAEEIAAAAERAGLVVAEAFMYRFHPQWTELAALIAGGAIGRLVHIDSAFCFRNDDPASSVGSAELGGGALLDVGCYSVNLTRLIGGEPLSVSANEHRDGVDQSFDATLELAGGVTATLHASIEEDELHRARFTGTTGTLVIEAPWLPAPDAPAVIRLEHDGVVVRRSEIPAANSYALELEDFVASAEGRRAPRWPFSEAIDNMRVIDALFRSAREGRAVAP